MALACLCATQVTNLLKPRWFSIIGQRPGLGQSRRFCSGYYASGLSPFADHAQMPGLQLTAITTGFVGSAQ